MTTATTVPTETNQPDMGRVGRQHLMTTLEADRSGHLLALNCPTYWYRHLDTFHPVAILPGLPMSSNHQTGSRLHLPLYHQGHAVSTAALQSFDMEHLSCEPSHAASNNNLGTWLKRRRTSPMLGQLPPANGRASLFSDTRTTTHRD